MTSTDGSGGLVRHARQLLAQLRAQQDGRDPNIAHLPGNAMSQFSRHVATRATKSIKQIVPFGDSWDPSSFDNAIWRHRAHQLDVARLFVVPHRGLGGGQLEQQLELDRAAGIDATVAYVSQVPEERQVALRGLWIIDESAVARAEGGPTPSGQSDAYWTVSDREEDLHRAIELWRGLVAVSESDTSEKSEVDLEEPLVMSADLINKVAHVLCTGDHVDPHGCSWYHGAWQYLRLLNLVSTPTWHSAFYTRAIGDLLTSSPAAEILITGTADYSVFAYIDAIARATNADPRITVLDQCATPLFACRWYGKRVGREVATVAEDLLTGSVSAAPGAWDAVITDAFLTRFSSEQSANVVRLWASLLRPGGKLITTIRVHAQSPLGRTPDEAVQDFRSRARHGAERWRSFLDKSPDQIAEAAEAYAVRMRSTDVGDREAIKALFDESPLTIEEEILQEVPGELHPTTYLELIAQRSQTDHTHE
jgi:hypothetical protein